jgi:thiol-disulfide isomerase/thioredoxin
MKTKTIIVLTLIVLLFGCNLKSKRPEPNYYKNLFTGNVLSKTEFEKFNKNLHLNYLDTTKGKTNIEKQLKNLNVNMHFYALIISKDSIIQPFKYDIRINNEYVVRADSFKKIGMKILPQKFQTINGDSIQIGGKQEKPILVNLWFIECPGCIGEMSALNLLQKKYADKVNFVSITFESKTDILKFLKRKNFNFKHIANSESFIKLIGTKPYPENIFINKDGYIEYIEGGLSDDKNLDKVTEHFDYLLNKMIEK